MGSSDSQLKGVTLPLSNHVVSTLRFTTQISYEDVMEEDDDENGEQVHSRELDANEGATGLESRVFSEQ
jgi:hypothetical protein